MIFASDLDQTLIYSPKSFRLVEGQPMVAVSPVEMYERRHISFMADEAMVKLQQIASNGLFVPATTRTIEQYKRISLFREKIIPAYSVVSNGGNVLINGVVDLVWQKEIKMNVEQGCLCLEKMLESFNEIRHDSWADPVRIADGLFYYCVVQRDQVPLKELEAFSLWAEGQNWKVSLQGRKLYLVPQVVNKWTAVSYIRDLVQGGAVVAAGDSLLDLCMLEQADYAIAPRHGEIWESYSNSRLPMCNVKFTKQAGILATNEILDEVATYIGCSLEKIMIPK
jgi:hypothetical protein